jgi:hypothetical protein
MKNENEIVAQIRELENRLIRERDMTLNAIESLCWALDMTQSKKRKTAVEILKQYEQRIGRHTIVVDRDDALSAMIQFANQKSDDRKSENETERLFIVAWHCMLNAKNMQQSDIDAGNKLFERLTAPKP